MKSNLTKFALSASIMLAIAFTFSCSSGDDNNGGSSSGSGGGGGSNQLYNSDGTPYTGSGVIKIRSCLDGDKGTTETLINAGSVTNGIVNLQLPTTIPDEYLRIIASKNNLQSLGCTDYPNEDIKGLDYCYGKMLIALVNNNLSADYVVNTDPNRTNYIGGLIITSQNQRMDYWYVSKSGKVTCSWTNNSGHVNKWNINATAGWNKLYLIDHNGANGLNDEYNTNNILTEEVKWTLQK
jgi:hypothetical protein